MIIVSSDFQNKFENEYIEKVIIPTSENIIKVNTKQFFDLDENIVNNSKLIVVSLLLMKRFTKKLITS